MARDLSQEDIAIIKSAARESCMNKGIPERINNPAVKNGTIKNPAFELCVLRETEIGMREARNGRLNKWIQSTKSMIQEQGGLIGVFEKLGLISRNIRNGEMPGAGENNEAMQGDTERGGEKAGKSNAIVWVAAAIFIVLIIVLTVMLLRKKNGQG